ncbi:hypothetical protein LZC95_26930 [Pendulispora brunnea]|uniref:Lipoprotein n=1 Tax=Pendulispora brunnea TaxID=2905690 RepID=A0ABZ2JYQ8_9BACT
MKAKKQALGAALGIMFAMMVSGCSTDTAEQEETTNVTSDGLTTQADGEFWLYREPFYGYLVRTGIKPRCFNVDRDQEHPSSLKIVSGNFRFYDNKDCKGGYLGLKGPKEVPQLSAFGWDNRIQSLEYTGP